MFLLEFLINPLFKFSGPLLSTTAKLMVCMRATASCLTTEALALKDFCHLQNTRGLAKIAQGLEKCLCLGNLDALRNLGYAKDFVRMRG